MATAPRVPLVVPGRRREGADRQVQRLPVPGLRPVVLRSTSRSSRSTRRATRRGQARHEGLPAEPRLQRRRSTTMLHPAACDAAVAVRLAQPAQARRGDGGVALHAPAGDDARRSVRQAARDIGQVTDFDAKYAATLEPGEGRRRPRPAARRQVDADVLHQRREDRRARGRRSSSTRRSRTSCNAPPEMTCPALATHELTKDYAVGFWRKRPYRALDRLTLDVERRRGLRLPRPERRRQDDDAEAADAAGLSDSGRAEILGRPLGDLDGQAPHRLPAGEPVLLRLPDRRGAADLLRGPVRLSPRPSAARASSACSTRSASAPSGACSCASSRRACCSASASRRR